MWVQELQNVLKYKYKHFKICQVQAKVPYFLKYLSPSTSTHMKYLSTFKHMTPLTQLY